MILMIRMIFFCPEVYDYPRSRDQTSVGGVMNLSLASRRNLVFTNKHSIVHRRRSRPESSLSSVVIIASLTHRSHPFLLWVAWVVCVLVVGVHSPPLITPHSSPLISPRPFSPNPFYTPCRLSSTDALAHQFRYQIALELDWQPRITTTINQF